MLVPVLAFAMMSSACPLYVGVSNDGNIFFDRFQGWIKVDATQLERVLHDGCKMNYSEPPEPITSLRFAIASKAPSEKVREVLSLLEKNGWTRENLTVEPWTSPLRKLSGRFFMDKQTFTRGERVVLHFEVINSGNDPYWFNTTGMPVMPFCAGYTVTALQHDGTPAIDARLVRGNSCDLNGQFQHAVIEPGGSYVQDIDLSVYLDVGTKGGYVIQAAHQSLGWKADPVDPLDVKATFKIELQ